MQKIKIWVDEAGRWPWLGPVVACALCFDLNNMPNKDLLDKINDSKKISEKKREEIYEELINLSIWDNKQVYFWVWVVDNYIIDDINIKQANKEAMRRALIELYRKISPLLSKEGVRGRSEVFIDWRDNYKFDELEKKPIYIVGWDWKILEIWAASIIAKVFRDKITNAYSSLYPDLSLENHKWYGTKKHQEYLSWVDKITWIHRLSYKPIKKILEEKTKLLLHVCCWPDATIPIVDLKDKYELICFWYDPNIQPKKEYNKRLKAFKKVCDIEKVEFIEWKYDDKRFFEISKGLEKEPEKWKRCEKCYDFRLKKTAELARDLWIKYFTTTLSISPHKNLDKIFEIWEKYSNTSLNLSLLGGKKLQKNVEFLKMNFRKNNWFERSVEYTKKHKIYRQDYCGCVYSIKK